MLRLGDCHTITWYDDDVLGLEHQAHRLTNIYSSHLSLYLLARGPAPAPFAEATQYDTDERAGHGFTHDVAQNRATATDERAGDDEEIVAQHEPSSSRSPAGVTVEHRHDHGHICTADRHNHVHAEQRCQGGHGQQWDHSLVAGADEL